MKANMTTTCAARGVININYRVKRCDEVNKYTIILLLKKRKWWWYIASGYNNTCNESQIIMTNEVL